MSDTNADAILAHLAAMRERVQAAVDDLPAYLKYVTGPYLGTTVPAPIPARHAETLALLAVAEAAARLREADADLAASFRSSGGRSNAYTMKRVEVSQRRARLDAALSALVAEGGGA